jgi:HlyD family secretion protein
VDVEVDFDVPEDCDCMLPGYSADIEIILDQREAVLRVPTEAIMEGNKVLRLTQDGLLEEQQIETGLSNWAWTEVTDGLQEKDQVVVSVDREGVKDGALAAIEDKSK